MSSGWQRGQKRTRDPEKPLDIRLQPAPPSEPPQILHWPRPSLIERQVEEDARSVLVHWGAKERGIMRSQPAWRLKKIEGFCRSHKLDLEQALSLRRHFMKEIHRSKTMQFMRLGSDDEIRGSSAAFELCIQEALDRQSIRYWDEDAQKETYRETRPMPPTPDFLLCEEIVLEGRGPIRWVEAKMFYGASVIAQDNRSAVGCLLQTARKYVRIFGPGVMVFAQGCGVDLASLLEAEGVYVVDCSDRSTVELTHMRDHMRTWCGDSNGRLLP